MALLKQSTAYTRNFLMVDSTDHITGKTGLTVTVTIAKAGGTFGAAGGTVTEISSGWYKIAFTTTDTNTVGELAVHCAATGADMTDFVDQVSASSLADLTNLDATVSSRLATAGYTAPPSAASVSSTVWGEATRALTDKVGFGLSALETMVLASGTAQAGAAGTITLAAGASAVTDFYVGSVVKIYGGTGIGQARVVTAYNSTTKVATLDRNWATNPDNTSTYAVFCFDTNKVNASLQAESSSVQGNVTGSVASVTGAVGSVTGAVGSVTGAVGSVTGAVASVTADVGITQAAADKVWGTTVRAITDKAGFALSTAGIAAIWDALLTTITTTASIGKLLKDDIDATISSRTAGGTYAAAPTASAVADAVWNRLTSAITTASSIGKLLVDNVNATVSSRMASFTYTAPPDVNAIADQVWDEALSGHAAGGSAGAALSAATAPSAAAVADAVWDEVLSGHLTGGTTGASLNGAGAAGDPWTASLPGSYGAGTAGKIVGDNVNATISSRSTLTAAGVWDALLTGIATSGSIGKLIKDYLNFPVASLPSATQIWNFAVGGVTTPNSMGSELLDTSDLATTNLDVAVSSRLATAGYTAPDNAGITTLTGRLTSGRATGLDNLDATVSSRLAAAGYTVPASVAAIAEAVWEYATSSINDAAGIGQYIINAFSPMTSVGMGVTTLLSRLTDPRAANLDNLDAAISSISGTSPSQIADAVWDVATSAHNIAGTTGEAILVAGGSTSPGQIADAVWDELSSDHVSADSFGAKLRSIVTGDYDVVSPVADSGTVTVTQGGDYYAAEGRSLDWFSTDFPTLTGATISLRIDTLPDPTLFAGTVIAATGTKHVRVEIGRAATALLGVWSYRYSLIATLTNGHQVPLVNGTFEVLDDVS